MPAAPYNPFGLMHHGVGKQCYQRFNIDEITQYLKAKDQVEELENHRRNTLFAVTVLLQ